MRGGKGGIRTHGGIATTRFSSAKPPCIQPHIPTAASRYCPKFVPTANLIAQLRKSVTIRYVLTLRKLDQFGFAIGIGPGLGIGSSKSTGLTGPK